MKPTIFLSHASEDEGLARALKVSIEQLLPNYRVFASTQPDGIPSGKPWFDQILDELDNAEALVIVLTVNSVNRTWIGYEFGYFWKKTSGKKIHILYHPLAVIPSPIDRLQAKRLTIHDELVKFATDLCSDLERELPNSIDFGSVAHEANSQQIPPTERSLAKFEQYVEKAKWHKVELHNEEREIWNCVEDVMFQIELDYGKSNHIGLTHLNWVFCLNKGLKPLACELNCVTPITINLVKHGSKNSPIKMLSIIKSN